MGRQLLDVEQGEPMPGEDTPGRPEREVGEVLVVDGVELVALHQPDQVGELDGHHPARLEQAGDPGHEAVEVRHLGQDVVGHHQVGLAPFAGQPAGQLLAEELGQGGDPSFGGHLGHVAGRLDPEHRDPPGDEVLQQVAVVAGQLDDQALGAQPEPLGGQVGVVAGVAHPGVGVGREVGVLGEDRLRGHVPLQLHQPALLADVGPQRVERLHLVELVGGEEALAQRRRPEVADDPGHRRRAEAARVADRW